MKPMREQAIQDIKTWYEKRDQAPVSQADASPFECNREGYRIQQYRAMAELFRQAGVLSLQGLRILDVGCGSGRLLRSFIELGAAPSGLVGLDISESRIATARALAPDIEFVIGGGAELPFPSQSFDLVTQYVVFSSIGLDQLRRQLAGEMIRVCRPGGFIFWWDMMATVVPGAQGQPLDLQVLFGALPRRTLLLGVRPRPSECIRPSRLRGILGRVVDYFAFPATHVAALIGPLSIASA
jgi:SAM-dependent methyltransferase